MHIEGQMRMRSKLGQVLGGSDTHEPTASATAPGDVTLRRFWSQGPRGVKRCGERATELTAPSAGVVDLAAWKLAKQAGAR
jgi:diadenosine tetraphosphatase ApaH/serine/threonine PP2A family protein phosphatase